jgi:glycosyltransferase involved in cell wall biosynthesis
MTYDDPKDRRPRVLQRRILVLAADYPSGGDGEPDSSIAKLVRAIQRQRYAVTVVAPSKGRSHGRCTQDGVEAVHFRSFWPHSLETAVSGRTEQRENILKALLGLLKTFFVMCAFIVVAMRELCNAEVVYAHRLIAGFIGAVVNLLTAVPLIVAFSGDDEVQARDRGAWGTLCRWVVRRAHMVVPTSESFEHILRDLEVPEGRCHVIHLGVDTDAFYPSARASKGAKEIRLLFVGSLTRRKGLQDLLDAMDDPDLRTVRLTVVGEGPYASVLVEMAALLSLGGRVEWRGAVPLAEVARIMRASDILCLPSAMEGRPRVVEEAMASALPVIVSRTGGIPDMVREGETALLFEPGDVQGLRENLRMLVNSSDLRTKMGRAGYHLFMQSEKHWDEAAEQLVALFERVSGEDW